MEAGMKAKATLALALACAMAAGCGQEKPQDPASKMERATREIGEAAKSGNMAQMGSAVKEMGSAFSEGTRVEPVDFRELAKLLPETIGALKKVANEGAKRNVVGVASSQAQATYENGKGGRLVLELTDAGSMTGLASMALAWVNVDIDKEGSDGYEKTTNVAGRKAYERYSKPRRTGELDVIVAGRFIVSAKATGLDMAAFKDAIGKLDLDKLEAMRTTGVAKK
jgi:hypothetical protein